jgi:hypothetical protein
MIAKSDDKDAFDMGAMTYMIKSQGSTKAQGSQTQSHLKTAVQRLEVSFTSPIQGVAREDDNR